MLSLIGRRVSRSQPVTAHMITTHVSAVVAATRPSLTVRPRCMSARTAGPSDTVLYRFAWVRSLRLMLRLKILQLGGGLGVMAPVFAAANNAPMALSDAAALGALGVGTFAVGGTLSWCVFRLLLMRRHKMLARQHNSTRYGQNPGPPGWRRYARSIERI